MLQNLETMFQQTSGLVSDKLSACLRDETCTVEMGTVGVFVLVLSLAVRSAAVARRRAPSQAHSLRPTGEDVLKRRLAEL